MMMAGELLAAGAELTQAQVDRFHEALVNATQNADIAKDAGRFTAFSKKIGAIKEITLGMMSPASVYLKAGKLYRTMSRGASIETSRISANKVQLISTPNPGVQEKRSCPELLFCTASGSRIIPV